MKIPLATYRLQVSADFPLERVRELVPYFAELGVSHLYLSPVTQARPGSTHGYDVTDPTRINKEIGGEAAFIALADEAKAHGLDLLLDIVPNHMAASELNPWWFDVLKHGPGSPYAAFFDIDWQAEPPGPGRVLLPILGDELAACVERGELKLLIDTRQFGIQYIDRVFPLDPSSYPLALNALGPMVAGRRMAEELRERAVRLPDRLHASERLASRRVAEELEAAMHELMSNVASERGADQLLITLDDSHIGELLAAQVYDLRFWGTGARDINYRRFFDISDLVGLRIEDAATFDAVHALTLPLLVEGVVSGVRIDHIDGLRDPAAYLERLRKRVHEQTGKDPYVVVEKILSGDERLPAEWATAGSTGYEFIATSNGVFVHPAGWREIGDAYERWTGITDFSVLVREKKRLAMTNLFPNELRSLATALTELAERDGLTLDTDAAREALMELTAHLPVYRTYIATDSIPEVARTLIQHALDWTRSSTADQAVCDFLAKVLLLDGSTSQRAAWIEFIARWQQFTGPVMAKGFEDTALYNYNRLISVNEVGADPRHAVVTVDQFHRAMTERQAHAPGSLNASSTHDTKRSEDVRARINVLSELWPEWLNRVERWREWNLTAKRMVDGVYAPDVNDELLLYQSLLGAWPLEPDALPAFHTRMQEYMLKAVREAKRRTSWRVQNDEYEAAVSAFTAALVARPPDDAFWQDLRGFAHRIAWYGALNALSQLVLKLGAPGVPDFYQGCESWMFALVDPDNRRSVDWQAARCRLNDLDSIDALLKLWKDGRIKTAVTRAGLHLRRDNPELFLHGTYTPLRVEGTCADHVVAYMRRLGEQTALFLATRWVARLVDVDELPIGHFWQDTRLVVDHQERDWTNVLTGTVHKGSGTLALADVLKKAPVAILTA